MPGVGRLKKLFYCKAGDKKISEKDGEEDVRDDLKKLKVCRWRRALDTDRGKDVERRGPAGLSGVDTDLSSINELARLRNNERRHKSQL